MTTTTPLTGSALRRAIAAALPALLAQPANPTRQWRYVHQTLTDPEHGIRRYIHPHDADLFDPVTELTRLNASADRQPRSAWRLPLDNLIYEQRHATELPDRPGMYSSNPDQPELNAEAATRALNTARIIAMRTWLGHPIRDWIDPYTHLYVETIVSGRHYNHRDTRSRRRAAAKVAATAIYRYHVLDEPHPWITTTHT